MNNINPTGMYGVVELVTPEMAETWLATASDVERRSIRVKRVRAYSDARRQGKWVLHHQGIAISASGKLLDGNHRLSMVAETKLPTVFFVVRNVPDESSVHMDEQLPRSVRDALKMAGKGIYSCSILSTARVIDFYPSGVDWDRVDREKIIANLKKYAEELAWVQERLEGQIGVSRAVRALVVRALLCTNQYERLDEFCSILRDGVPLSENRDEDLAATNYRNLLLRMIRLTGGHAEKEKYTKGQTCVEYFLARRPMSKIYGTDADLFPLPDHEMSK